MPIEDLMNLPADVPLTADVCLVGSGPAAWTLAKELSDARIRVLILESGGGRSTADTEALNETEDVGMPLFNGRCRIFGGTTEMPGWANRCIAFDEIDYEKRSWVPFSGWPFGPDEVEPYLSKAAAYLGAERLSPRTSIPPPPRGVDKAEIDLQLLSQVYWGFGRDRFWAPTRFSGLFRAHPGDNVRVILHATVTHLDTDPHSGRIVSVQVADTAGRTRTIPSRLVVLCAGGIENARLLLNSNRQVATGLGNAHDLVGRFLMDHPRDLGMALTFDPREAATIRRFVGPFHVDRGAGSRLFLGGFALSPEIQRRENLLNCAAWPEEEFAADDPVEAAFRLARRKPGQRSADLRRVLTRPGYVFRAAHSRLVLDQPIRRLPAKVGFIIASEQQPDPNSRVSLAERRDRFGLRLARTDWRIGRTDRASQGRLAKLIAAEFKRLGLPEARLASWIRDEAYDDTVLQDGCHPTGTTRLAADPTSGVVNPDCEVFDVGGLYVAGSSVFPTAGHANPTLMIVAMACRLAEHLKLQVGAASASWTSEMHGADVDEELTESPWPPVVASGTSVAVTGANGFIGGRLVERLTEQGAIVKCLNRGASNARIQRTGATACRVDLADVTQVKAALEGVQIVFHCAYDWSDEDWNLRALSALMAASSENGCERFVHISSYVVYELPSYGEVTETTEETAAASGYSRIKRDLELELLEAHQKRGFPCVILQPTVVYGAHSNPWTVQPAESMRFGTVVLPDKGEGLCPAVHVDDVVDAMLVAATNPRAIGERFLVSGPEPVTWSDFYERLADAAGVPGPTYVPLQQLEMENSKLGKLRRLVSTPERLVRRVGQVRPVRKVVRTAIRVLPSGLRNRLDDSLYGRDSRRRGYVHIPDLGHLHWISGRSTIMSGKARQRLGYRPRVGLTEGMDSLKPYLRELLSR